MKRLYQVTGLLFVLPGYSLKVQGDFGPSPGLFPFWGGLVVAFAGRFGLHVFEQILKIPSPFAARDVLRQSGF